jgi:transposase InsO family protein
LAATRVRYGYRRIHVLLQREGWQINHKRTRRIYRELGLQIRNKTPKQKVKAKLREDRVQAAAPNECGALNGGRSYWESVKVNGAIAPEIFKAPTSPVINFVCGRA